MLSRVRFTKDALGIIKDIPPPPLVCVELNPGPEEVDKETRIKIIACVQDAGLGITETARLYGMDRRTVQILMSKVKKTKSVKNHPGRGRKRTLSESLNSEL